MIILRVAFGEELAHYLESAKDENIWELEVGTQEFCYGEIREIQFNTPEEVDAYIQGCSDMDGWGVFYTLTKTK